MRKFMVKAGVVAASFVMLSTGVARAATVDVKVPFPFLVNGQTMPAGQYRVTDQGDVVEIAGEKGTKAIAFVLTNPTDGVDPAGRQPALVFTHEGKQMRLVDIWESPTQGVELHR